MRYSLRPFGLWVSIPRNDAGLCRAAVEAGADVIKIHSLPGSGSAFWTW